MKKQDIILRTFPVLQHWEVLSDYLELEKETLMQSLIVTSNIRDVNLIQGKVLMIEELMKLPSTVQNLKYKQ